MLALKMIGGIVLFFCLLMLIPVGARAAYSEDGFFLWLKVACFSIRLFPMRKEKPASQKKNRRTKKIGRTETKKKQPVSEAQAPENDQPKTNKAGELKKLLPLIRPALTTLSRLRRKLSIRQLRVFYRIGGASDPANAAVKYGIVSAGGGAFFPLINGAFQVKKWDVDLGVDFESDQTRVAFTAEGGWLLGQLVAAAFSLGVSAISILAKRPKKQSQNQKEEFQHGRKASDR